MSVVELKSAISSLTPDELVHFSEWFEDFRAHTDGPPHLTFRSEEDLRVKIQAGIDQLDRGDSVVWDLEGFLARGKERNLTRQNG